MLKIVKIMNAESWWKFKVTNLQTDRFLGRKFNENQLKEISATKDVFIFIEYYLLFLQIRCYKQADYTEYKKAEIKFYVFIEL